MQLWICIVNTVFHVSFKSEIGFKIHLIVLIYLIKFGKCRSLVLFVVDLVIFGDIKKLSTLKNTSFYTQGNKNKIISTTFLLDHSVIKKCVGKPHFVSHMMEHMKRNENKKNYCIFSHSEKSFEIYKKKRYLQVIFTISSIYFLYFFPTFSNYVCFA